MGPKNVIKLPFLGPEIVKMVQQKSLWWIVKHMTWSLNRVSKEFLKTFSFYLRLQKISIQVVKEKQEVGHFGEQRLGKLENQPLIKWENNKKNYEPTCIVTIKVVIM